MAAPDLRSQAVHSAKWVLIENLTARALSLVTFAVLARLLAPEAFGLLGLAVVVIALCGLFVDTGVSEAIIQRRHMDRELLDTAFWLSVLAGTLLAIICFAAAGPVAGLYGQPELAPVLRVLSVVLFLQSLASTQDALLRRHFRFKAAAARRIVASVVGSVVAVAWAVASPSVWALVAQTVATSMAGVVVLWSVSGYRPGLHGSRKHARSLVNFGVNVLGIRLAFFAGEYGDNFVIGLVLGPRALGYYVVGYRVFRIITEVVTSTLSAVTLPVFSRLQDDRERLVRAFLSVTRLSLSIAVPAFASGAVLAPYLIPALFGDGWGPSIEVMQILSLVGLVTCVASFDRSALIAVGRVRLELAIAVSGALAAVVAFVVGAQWGINGVAIAIVVRAYLFWPVRMLALRAVIGLPLGIYLLQWLLPVACGIGMVLAMLGVGALVPAPARFVSELVTGPLVYAALLRLAAPAAFHELVDTMRSALRPLLPQKTAR